MGFSNHAQRFTGPNLLNEPLTKFKKNSKKGSQDKGPWTYASISPVSDYWKNLPLVQVLDFVKAV